MTDRTFADEADAGDVRTNLNAVITEVDALLDAGHTAAAITTQFNKLDNIEVEATANSDADILTLVGGMFTGNTETRINVTYQSGDGTVDFAVDDDLANYDNSNTAFIAAAGVTFEALDANSDVGTGSAQVAAGDHTHSNYLTSTLAEDLDVGGNALVSSSNGDITLTPNGTGDVVLGTFVIDADATVGAGQDNYVLTYDHGTGKWGPEAASGGGGGGTSWDDAVDADIVPDADGTRDLGSSANRFAELHVDTIDLAGTTITATGSEINLLSGVTSAIQTQINAKPPKIYVHNDTGGTLGRIPVRIASYDSDSGYGNVVPADADDANGCDGILDSAVTNGAVGELRTHGLVYGINTASFSEGDRVWVKSGGGFTNEAPQTGNITPIGRVARSDASNGIIYAHIGEFSSGLSSGDTIDNKLGDGVFQLNFSANPVNLPSLTASDTADAVIYGAGGPLSDTNVTTIVAGKGTGQVVIRGGTPAVLTSATSITPDCTAASLFTLELDHNGTLNNPTALALGQTGVFVVTQGSTGGTLGYGSHYKFPGGPPTLSAGTGDVDVIVGTRITASIIVCYSLLDVTS